MEEPRGEEIEGDTGDDADDDGAVGELSEATELDDVSFPLFFRFLATLGLLEGLSGVFRDDVSEDTLLIGLERGESCVAVSGIDRDESRDVAKGGLNEDEVDGGVVSADLGVDAVTGDDVGLSDIIPRQLE